MVNKNNNTKSQLRLERYGQERFNFAIPKTQSKQLDVWKAFINQSDQYDENHDIQIIRTINLARHILISSAQCLFRKNKKDKEQAYKFIFMPNKRFGKVCNLAHVSPKNFRKLVTLALDGQIPKPERYDTHTRRILKHEKL